MLQRTLALGLAGWLGLAGCAREPDEAPQLRAAERTIVDAYVRLSVLEALHREQPDSVETLLQRHGGAFVDTLAVLRAADSLSSEPLRWELVFDAITRRLTELDARPDTWWSVVRGDSSVTAP